MQFLNVALLMAGVLAPSAVLASPVASPDPAPAPAPGFIDVVPESSSSGGIVKRSFIHTCSDCELAPYPAQRMQDLVCKCKNIYGQPLSAYLNLDECYLNVDGTPILKRNGSFSGSCRWYDKGNQYGGNGEWRVEAECRRKSGDMVRTNWNLNLNIHNDNGRLFCDAK